MGPTADLGSRTERRPRRWASPTHRSIARERSMRRARRCAKTAARHPSFVKIWVDDFHGQMAVKLSPTIYRAVIDEAHAQGLRVAAHVYYLSDAKQLVADGVDVLAHGVRDVPVDQEFIDALKLHHVWYVPTLGLDESFYLFAKHPEMLDEPLLAHAVQPQLAQQLSDPDWRAGVLGNTKKLGTDEGTFAMNSRNLKTLFDAGVQIGFGTDSGATPLRIAGFAEHRELRLMGRCRPDSDSSDRQRHPQRGRDAASRGSRHHRTRQDRRPRRGGR